MDEREAMQKYRLLRNQGYKKSAYVFLALADSMVHMDKGEAKEFAQAASTVVRGFVGSTAKVPLYRLLIQMEKTWPEKLEALRVLFTAWKRRVYREHDRPHNKEETETAEEEKVNGNEWNKVEAGNMPHHHFEVEAKKEKGWQASVKMYWDRSRSQWYFSGKWDGVRVPSPPDYWRYG